MTPSVWLMWVQLGVERVLNSLPVGLLIAAATWLLLRVVGRQNSKTRFVVWFSALLAVVASPFVTGLGGGSRLSPVAEVVLPGFWAVAIFTVWMFIAVLATARAVAGLWNLRSLRRNSAAIDVSNLHPVLRETVERFKSGRPLAVCLSSTVRVPTVIGFFSPLILLPEWALRELSPDELKIVLLHEFAHLRRWDDWTNLAQKMVRAVFFFHPAVWWIEKRLSLEREMACDDMVLAETENPRAYAECLVSLAEKSFMRRGLAMAQAVISHARETSLRLAQILDVNRAGAGRITVPALGMVTVLAAFCLVALPHTPTLVAFGNPAAPPAITAMSAPGPQLSQAVMHQAAARTETAVRHRDVSGQPVAATSRVPLVATRQTQSRPGQLVQAAAKQTMPEPQVRLFMQTTQYDERGEAIWRMTVWKLTFTSAGHSTDVVGVIVKQI